MGSMGQEGSYLHMNPGTIGSGSPLEDFEKKPYMQNLANSIKEEDEENNITALQRSTNDNLRDTEITSGSELNIMVVQKQ